MSNAHDHHRMLMMGRNSFGQPIPLLLNDDGSPIVPNIGPSYATIAAAAAAIIPNTVNDIMIFRYDLLSAAMPAPYSRVSSEPSHGLKFFSSGSWWENVAAVVYVEMAGARGNGIADDWEPIQICLDVKRPVRALGLTYNVSKELLINYVGYDFRGTNQARTIIRGTGLTGHVIRCTQRQGTLMDFTVTASDARNALPYSTTTRGIEIGGFGAGSLTGTRIERVHVIRQPGDGLKLNRVAANSLFLQVWTSYNRGHGQIIDDGTSEGLPQNRIGIINFVLGRSVGNGGNGYGISSTSGTTAYRIRLVNCEIYSNAWNTPAISPLVNAEIVIRGQNIRVVDCAVGDPNYLSTTNENKKDNNIDFDTRLAKVNRSEGIRVSSFCSDIYLLDNRFIDVNKGVKANTAVRGLTIDGALFEEPTTLGFDIDDTAIDVSIRIADTTNLTNVIATQSTGVRLRKNGFDYLVIGPSSADIALEQVVTGTIGLGGLNLRGTTVSVNGEGGVADDLTTLQFAVGIDMPRAMQITIVNLNSYAITIKHGTGNIFTKTGADVVLLGSGTGRRGISVQCVAAGVYVEV